MIVSKEKNDIKIYFISQKYINKKNICMLPRTDIKPTELLPNRCICTVMLQRLFEWRREVEKGAQVSGSRAVVNVFLFFFDCYVTSRHAKKNPTIRFDIRPS